MAIEFRRSGIDIIGDIPWGTHFCQFYRTADDLLDILVPYFAAGLEANEFCMWVTSEPVDVKAAERALAAAIPDFARRLRDGQMEILPHDQWYLAGGGFDAQRVLDAWAGKLEQARARGFDGLRLSGNTFWLEKEDWRAFTDYEAAVDQVIGKNRILAVCTYSLDRCGANEVLDVVRNHRFALARRESRWEVLESAERERARLAERRLAQFPQENPYPVLRVDRDGALLFANPAARRFLEALGTTGTHLVPAPLGRIAARAFDESNTLEIEIGDEAGRTYLFTAVRPPEEPYVNLYACEVTKRARAEKALRESEEKYRTLFETMTEGFALYELIEDAKGQPVDWRILEVNDAYTHHTGIARDKVVGRLISEAFPVSLAEYLPIFARVVAAQTPVDFETYVKAVDRHMHIVTYPLGGRRFASIIEDITARRRAEQALKASEERYRSLFNNMTEGFALHEIITDDAGRPCDYRFIDINPAFERMTGLDRAGVLGRLVREVLKDIESFWIEIYGRVALTGEPHTFERYYPDPINRWFEVYAYRPAPRQFAVIFMDISERKQAESLRRALVEQEKLRLGAAVEQASEAVIMADPDGRILYVNAAFEAIHRLPKDAVLGKDYFDLVAAGPRAADMREAVMKGRSWDGQLTLERPGERPVKLRVIASFIKDPAGVLITERDMTQEFVLQEQVRQAQKMEALGTLAGGIAHDFNNILGAIIINTELALIDAEEGCRTRESLPLVLRAAERGKELVKQIVTFSQKREWDRNPLLLAPVVKEALKLFRPTLPGTVSVHEAIGAEDAAVMAHPAQVHQLLLNLCQNASLAIGDKPGRLEIRLEKVQVDAAMASRHAGLNPGPYVRLTVADSGSGMPREVLERVFEPFFTTRSPGEGSGLGLSVVHGIVKSYGGAITAYSEVGKGSTFSVFLPSLPEESRPPEPAAAPEAERGHERILLVDDDQAQLHSLARVLEKLGYKVTPRASGRTALMVFKKHPDAFDLVITDQTMPRMSGLELARSLVKVRPEIPIILNTGFSEKVNGESVGKDGIRAFMMKPFTAGEISGLIRKVLDRES